MIRLCLHSPLHLSYHLTYSQRVTTAHRGPVLTHTALWINIHTGENRQYMKRAAEMQIKTHKNRNREIFIHSSFIYWSTFLVDIDFSIGLTVSFSSYIIQSNCEQKAVLTCFNSSTKNFISHWLIAYMNTHTYSYLVPLPDTNSHGKGGSW